MTPNELKHRLFFITNSEEKYRSGVEDEKLEQFTHLNIGGKDVLQFSYANIFIENNAMPYLVRKHSRFRDYPYHIHDWIEISYMYSGSCTQVIRGKRYPMKEGQLLLMKPGIIHTIEALGEKDILVQIALGQKYLTSNFFTRLPSSSIVSSFFVNAFNISGRKNNFYLFHSENSRRLSLFIQEFLCEWHEPSLASLDILNGLFSLILSELVNVMDVSSEQKDSRHNNSYILPLLHYIENNYKDSSLSAAAKDFGLNPTYLSSLLKKHTGFSYNELVCQQKLNVAKRLLDNSEMAVTEIANYIGYQNMSFFYRKFKQIFGSLPGEYREEKSSLCSIRPIQK